MMTEGKPYSIHKRGKIYYCQFKTADGAWTTARTTRQTSRANAETWAIQQITSGRVRVHSDNPTFENYSRDFFTWDSEWSLNRRAAGHRHSLRNCREKTALLKNHILPAIGNMKINDIDTVVIKSLRNDMFRRGVSASSINKTLIAIKSILSQAEEHGLISRTPRFERASGVKKERGTLTLEEVRRLFSVQWYDHRGRVGNLIAATAGLRMGEIRALHIGDVDLNEGIITVSKSYDDKTRTLNKTTKGGKTRYVFIPGIVVEEIRGLISIHPDARPEKFLFFSMPQSRDGEPRFNPDKPCEARIFKRSFEKALREIGISSAEQWSRAIVFHSWRGFVNSLLVNSRIPLLKIQTLIGHTSTGMTELYYKPNSSDYADVRSVQESMFKADGWEGVH